MKPCTSRTVQGARQDERNQKAGPNWVLIAAGAMLSTLSIRIGCRLKQAFEAKQSSTPNFSTKGKRRRGACQLHSNLYHVTQAEDGCYYSLAGIADGTMHIKQAPDSPMAREAEKQSLQLVKISPAESNNQHSCVIWASSPDRPELARKPFHQSNSSESPCVSESGSDIYSKREVIQKLRQQIKRRDEMILEMQSQIVDLQISVTAQVAHSASLQSQLDSANQELFDSERELQRLRKAIADHCMAEVNSTEKPMTTRNWRSKATNNGHVNGYLESVDYLEPPYVDAEISKGDSERIEMLKKELTELKELIDGKEFLIQSYKEKKVELCSTVKELQLRLASQVPNIL